MTYELSEQEKQGVLAASDEKRYAYFVNKAADWGEVWTLADGDSLVSLHVDDQKYFVAWPHPGFADDSIGGDWAAFEPSPIEVHQFLGILEALEDRGDEVALFRTAEGDFVTVPPSPLAADLRTALDEIE